MARVRKPEGEYALSSAERPAADFPATGCVKRHKPVDRRSRPQRWDDALTEMLAVHAECTAWFDALSEILHDSVTAVEPQAIIDLDHDALAKIEPPRGDDRG
jgi:hypothetical protein